MPVYLGGTSEVALRRVGRRADGWLPAGIVPQFFSPEMFTAQREIVRSAAREAGRREDLPTVVRANVPAGTSVAQIAGAIQAVAAATGITDYFVDLMYLAQDVEQALNLVAELLRSVSADVRQEA